MTASPILSPLKFCKKCQCETERNPSGGCRPCRVMYLTENKDKISLVKAQYYRKHIDAVKATSSRTYERSKEKVCAASKLWAINNPEKIKITKNKHAASGKESITKQKYAFENADRLKSAKQAWYEENPESVYRANHARRARKINSGGVLSKDIKIRLFALQRGKCACCGEPLGNSYHLDHIMPLALGGSNTDDNIQLLRQRCNNQKHAKHPVDFMQERGFLL